MHTTALAARCEQPNLRAQAQSQPSSVQSLHLERIEGGPALHILSQFGAVAERSHPEFLRSLRESLCLLVGITIKNTEIRQRSKTLLFPPLHSYQPLCQYPRVESQSHQLESQRRVRVVLQVDDKTGKAGQAEVTPAPERWTESREPKVKHGE